MSSSLCDETEKFLLYNESLNMGLSSRRKKPVITYKGSKIAQQAGCN